MAAITPTKVDSTVDFAVATTALSASDTFVYKATSKQVLILRNTTGSDVPVTIDGSGATTLPVPGYGGSLNIASGKVITVPANAVRAVDLKAINAFLKGSITITGGTGVTASLLEY